MKKLLFVLLAIMLAFTMVSCVGLGTNPNTNNNQNDSDKNDKNDDDEDDDEDENSHTHTVVIDEAVAPTCTESGLTEGVHCSVCKEVIVAQTVVEALGHKEVTDEAVAPTLNSTGLTEGKHCSVCNKVLVAQNTIPMLSSETALYSKALTVDGRNISGKVSNATEVFSFINDITVTNNSPWVLSTDSYGMNAIVTKTAPLSEGENVFYIHVTNPDQTVSTYTINLYRNRMCKVEFLEEGRILETQYIEEGNYADVTNIYQPLGYIQVSWDYDFTTPITSDITVTLPEKKVAPEMQCFNFVSTTSTCEITGVIDTSISELTIPDYVTSIGDGAFHSCTSLTSITIPDSVTSIGDDAFYYCLNLANIIVHTDNIKYKSVDGNLYSKDGKTLIQYAIGKNETSFIIPNSITSIGDRAFLFCTSLTSVTMGNSVTSIGSSAFASCISLTNVTIPDSVSSIGDRAFSSCASITSFVVDTNNPAYKSIDGNLYSKDGKILIQYAIGKNDTSFVILDSVTTIGEGAFFGCKSLTSVTIGDSVTSIGGGAFSFCTSLTSVTIPDSVTSIGSSAFYKCSLTSVTIPDSVTSIGDNAFSYCTSLTSVTIGDSVTSIGDNAFYHCTNLTSVTIGNSVTSIGRWAFDWCNKLVEVINHSSLVIVAGSSNYGWVAHNAKEVHNGESKIVNKDDYLFYTYGGVNYLLGYAGNDTKLTLPESYNGEEYEIYWYAFYERDDITEVTIPDSVTSIDYDAFSGCTSLTSINYTGTEKQWNAISKSSYWNSNTGSYTITYNYKGE